YDIPAVARRIGFVDNQYARSALTGSLFKLVGPASIIRHRIALEEGLVIKAGVVDHDDDRFSFDFEIGVIVPVIFGRDDPEAREYHIRFWDLDFRREVTATNHEVIQIIDD